VLRFVVRASVVVRCVSLCLRLEPRCGGPLGVRGAAPALPLCRSAVVGWLWCCALALRGTSCNPSQSDAVCAQALGVPPLGSKPHTLSA
jgi:hypothetical protein